MKEEEPDIKPGSLIDKFRKESLREKFVNLGLMHLKGDKSDVEVGERLTLEDEVNIVAHMALEGK